jgi:UDP-N-acetyl-D-mannosaminuronic acid dehydrogenase
VPGNLEIENKIKEKDVTICVLGLGYIGLPTALFYKKHGFRVIGIDTNQSLIDDLSVGKIHINEEGLDEIAEKYLGQIALHSSYDSASDGDIFILCLPSPIDQNKKPVLGYLQESVVDLAKRVKKEVLILVESTVPVGTTSELAEIFSRESGMKIDQDFWFAHTPERVMPGQIIYELDTNHRLVGGVTEDSTLLVVKLFEAIFEPELIHATNSRVSETAKLAENTFRDINLAYANELAQLCKVLGIEVNEVIKLANFHPRVDILNPGIGVGGYCLPKDGWLLFHSIAEESEKPILIPTARKVNDSMPHQVYEIVKELDVMSLKTKIGILGLTYKPNIADTRNSPALELIQLLRTAGQDVLVFDSHIERDYGAIRTESVHELLANCDIIVLAVGHDAIISSLRSADLREKILVDPGNAVPDLKSSVKRYIGLSI